MNEKKGFPVRAAFFGANVERLENLQIFAGTINFINTPEYESGLRPTGEIRMFPILGYDQSSKSEAIKPFSKFFSLLDFWRKKPETRP